MKSTIGWIVAILLGLLLLILLPGAWMLGYPWMGRYGGMMGGFNFMHPFGWGGMFLVWLIPVGAVILLVVGAITLINSFNRSGQLAQPPDSQPRTCLNCGKSAQADWSTCPYCGQKLT